MKYIIYKIEINNHKYIGSTKNFTQRKASHKASCLYESRATHNCLLYRTIRENGGWNCCTMIPVKEIEVESKTQAHIAEEATRIEYNAQMNTRRAHRTEEELKEDKRQYQQTDAYKESMKKYQQTDAYKEYQKQYKKKTETYKEYMKQYKQTDAYKEYQKQYNQSEERKEYMKQYNKQYQQSDSYKNYKREYGKQRYLEKKAKKDESPEIKVET